MGKYDDIISLEVPTSKNHPRMSMNNRAAQFAPFAALVGYAEAINSSREVQDERKIVSEDKKIEIEGLLHQISSNLSQNCYIEITYYQKDENTKNGKYVLLKGYVKKINIQDRVIVFKDKTSISINDIYDLRILDQDE